MVSLIRMSISVAAIILPVEKMDKVWDRVIGAGKDRASDELLSLVEELGADEAHSGINDGYIVDILEPFEDGDSERAKICIAELDQELAVSLALQAHHPDSGGYASLALGIFCKVLGLGTWDEVTTEQWIQAFRSLTQEQLDAMQQLTEKEELSWEEVYGEIRAVREIAKYAHEHASTMAVFVRGDAILTQPFTDRAAIIYKKLQDAWSA